MGGYFSACQSPMIHTDLFSPQPSPHLSWAIHTPDLLTKRFGFISGPDSLVCVAAAGLMRSSRTQLCPGRVSGCPGRCCGPVAGAWKPRPSATVCASFCLLMFPFPHGWEFSQAPSAHQVFPPSVCSIRRGRIGPSADNLKGPPFLIRALPFLSMNYPSQGQGWEGAVSTSSCPVRAVLENHWRRCQADFWSWSLWTGVGLLPSKIKRQGWAGSDNAGEQRRGGYWDEGTAPKGRQGVAPGSPVAQVDVGVCTLGEGPFEKETWRTAIWTRWRARTARQPDLAWNRLLTPCWAHKKQGTFMALRMCFRIIRKAPMSWANCPE